MHPCTHPTVRGSKERYACDCKRYTLEVDLDGAGLHPQRSARQNCGENGAQIARWLLAVAPHTLRHALLARGGRRGGVLTGGRELGKISGEIAVEACALTVGKLPSSEVAVWVRFAPGFAAVVGGEDD